MQEVIEEYKYRVIAVEKTTAPDGLTGNNWYRYVIQKGKSVMECKKPGSLKEVTVHAESVADLINSRNGRGSPKKPVAKIATS
jgi:hypothetical protein